MDCFYVNIITNDNNIITIHHNDLFNKSLYYSNLENTNNKCIYDLHVPFSYFTMLIIKSLILGNIKLSNIDKLSSLSNINKDKINKAINFLEIVNI